MPRLAPVTSATWPANSSDLMVMWSDNSFGKQRKLVVDAVLVEIGQRRRIIAGEAGVAILRAVVGALRFAERAIEAVDGEEGQAGGVDEIRHLSARHLRREQIGRASCGARGCQYV